MKAVKGKTGREIFPNVEFWADLPSLVKVSISGEEELY